MEAMETIDWGAYAHFAFMAQNHPEFKPFVKTHYYISTYVVLLGLMAIVFIVFLLQHRRRAALVASLGFIISLGIVEVCRLLVPRRRPPDAQNWLGADDMLGSYPSAGAFLFMLMMILFVLAFWPLARSPWLRGVCVCIATILTVGVALSQLFLAIHFVSDIIGGIVGATIVGIFVAKFLDPPQSPSNGERSTRDETAIQPAQSDFGTRNADA